MKASSCSVCGCEASVTYREAKGGATYGVECPMGHGIMPVFETKNRAIRAWNECQSFVQRYMEEDDLR